MTQWTSLKGQLVDSLGVERDLLHVPFGILLFSLLVLVFWRRADRLSLALFGLLLLQLVNEALDAVQWVLWTGRIPWSEAAWDTAVTLAVPLAAVLVLSVIRRLHVRRVPLAPCSDHPRDAQGRPDRPLASSHGDVA